MIAETPGEKKGLLDSLSNLTSSLVTIIYTRLDLLSSDLEEERGYLISLIALWLIALFCFGAGILLSAILLVVIFWDTHRVLTLSLLTGLFLVTGFAAWWYAAHKSRTKPRVFSASMAELLKDHEQLNAKH